MVREYEIGDAVEIRPLAGINPEVVKHLRGKTGRIVDFNSGWDVTVEFEGTIRSGGRFGFHFKDIRRVESGRS